MLSLLGMVDACHHYIFHLLELFITVLQVLYSMPLRRRNTGKVRGVLSFKAVFHHAYEAAQVWVAAKDRFVSRQLCVCLAAGLP